MAARSGRGTAGRAFGDYIATRVTPRNVSSRPAPCAAYRAHAKVYLQSLVNPADLGRHWAVAGRQADGGPLLVVPHAGFVMALECACDQLSSAPDAGLRSTPGRPRMLPASTWTAPGTTACTCLPASR